MFEIFKRRKRTQERPPAGASRPKRDAARQAPEAEPSTDAEDFHVGPEEIFQEEEQDGQGSSPRLHGE